MVSLYFSYFSSSSRQCVSLSTVFYFLSELAFPLSYLTAPPLRAPCCLLLQKLSLQQRRVLVVTTPPTLTSTPRWKAAKHCEPCTLHICLEEEGNQGSVPGTLRTIYMTWSRSHIHTMGSARDLTNKVGLTLISHHHQCRKEQRQQDRQRKEYHLLLLLLISIYVCILVDTVETCYIYNTTCGLRRYWYQ